jgi:CBS domain-containing membrane protein
MGARMESQESPAGRPRPTPLVDKPAWRRNAGGALGALIGITLTAAVTRMAMPGGGWLVAPMGASALLVFALPASPLAQPWPVIGGNLIAAAIGLLCSRLGADPVLAAGLAVGLATAAMMASRCLHPPAGGTAALMALGSPAIAEAGWGFLARPIAINLIVLVIAGIAWNRLTGHLYPHRARPAPAGANRDLIGEIEAVLEAWEDNIDIDVEDLAALIRAVEARGRSA